MQLNIVAEEAVIKRLILKSIIYKTGKHYNKRLSRDRHCFIMYYFFRNKKEFIKDMLCEH